MSSISLVSAANHATDSLASVNGPTSVHYIMARIATMGHANTSNPARSVVEDVPPVRHSGDYEGFGGWESGASRLRDKGTMEPVDLVYGLAEIGDNLVILPEQLAREVTQDYRALAAASTYKDARALTLLRVEAPGLEDDADDHPDDAPYDWSSFEEWPIPAATISLSWITGVDDLEDIGVEEQAMISTPRLYINPDAEDEVVAAIRALGYKIRRDDALVNFRAGT